jgi:hypothetical protein
MALDLIMNLTTDKSKNETKDKGIFRNAEEYERVGIFRYTKNSSNSARSLKNTTEMMRNTLLNLLFQKI